MSGNLHDDNGGDRMSDDARRIASVAIAEMRRILHGAVGIAVAVTGLDPAEPELVQRRMAICGECEHSKFKPGKCDLCGCLLGAKIRLASEKCPDDPARW